MENQVIKEIGEYLVSKGWKQDNNTWSIDIQQPGATVFINGQQQEQKPIIKTYTMTYEGEGMVDDTPIYGFNLNDLTTYVYDLEDFKNTYNI